MVSEEQHASRVLRDAALVDVQLGPLRSALSVNLDLERRACLGGVVFARCAAQTELA